MPAVLLVVVQLCAHTCMRYVIVYDPPLTSSVISGGGADTSLGGAAPGDGSGGG